DDLALHRAELNRAVDTAANDWIVIVRERESVSDALAAEIAEGVKGAKAWGFRIRTVPMYAGRPLRIGSQAGELRLFHRRHFLRRGEMGVQGTVVRLSEALTSTTFASSSEHREYLSRTAVPHSTLRRTLIFLRNAVLQRARAVTPRRYPWIEAALDHGRYRSGADRRSGSDAPHRAQAAVGAELPRRHPEAFAELLAEVVLGVEPAAARDLGDAHVAALEQARGLAEAFFLEEVAEKTSGDAVESDGYVLASVDQFFYD